jgi:hypothetical protein
MKEPINAREAEAYIPPLARFAGNYRLKAKMLRNLHRPAEEDANSLIVGDSGTGKSSMVIAYLREQLNNPGLYFEDFNDARKESKKRGERLKSLEEEREWQTSRSGNLIYFMQIDGATDCEADLRRKIVSVRHNLADHAVAFCDELGEIFFRGLDEALRPMLTEAGITTYATAQNFHSKRKTDSASEEDQRLSALLRRFTHRETTEKPSDADHVKFLAFLVKEWSLKLDDISTLFRLVEMSNGIVGYSKRILVKSIDEPDRRLTRGLVEDSDVDPLW